jgi:hypothetical protein
MNGGAETPLSTIAPLCAPSVETAPDRQVACFPLRADDSSRSVTENRAERTDLPDPSDPRARSQVAPEVEPSMPAHEAPPRTSDEALRLAIKLAVDAGEYKRAVELLEVAKRTATKQASVTALAIVRERRREE